MYAIPKKLLKKLIAIRKEKAELDLMNFTPSSISSAVLLVVSPWCGTLRREVTAAMVRKPAPATKKAVSVPAPAMIKPASAGAGIRAPCHKAEFRATALVMTLRSINRG